MPNEGDFRAVAISAAAIAIGFSQRLLFTDDKGGGIELFQLFADVAAESLAAHVGAVNDDVPWTAIWAYEVDVPLGRRIADSYIEQGSLPSTATWKAALADSVKYAYIPW